MTEIVQISFRPLREDDLPRLIEWLNATHIAAWWKPGTPAETMTKYLPRLNGETAVRVYAILLDMEPIGMMQAYPVNREAEINACGIDLLIGHPSLIGRGLGAQIIGQFVRDEIFGRLGFSACVADPDATNQRSVRAFEKAGFVHSRFVEAGGVIANIMAREAVRVEASTLTRSQEANPDSTSIST